MLCEGYRFFTFHDSINRASSFEWYLLQHEESTKLNFFVNQTFMRDIVFLFLLFYKLSLETLDFH